MAPSSTVQSPEPSGRRPVTAPAFTSHDRCARTKPKRSSSTSIAASRKLMGLDSQIIADRTYFIVESDGVLAGCGGWSRRITTYGGDHTPGRVPAPLTPGVDAARIRAMYTAPEFLRRGVGRLILGLCEDAAHAAGYDRAELVATLGGEPLYRAAGYAEIERFEDDRGGAPVPLVRMGKRLTAA